MKANLISRAAFAPYGDLFNTLKPEENPSQIFDCNQGRAQRYHDLASSIHVTGGRVGVSIYRSSASFLPFTLEVVERHPLGSQLFLPLNPAADTRYLIAVAAAGDFSLETMQAFIVPGDTAVNYRPGVWHLPIVALDKPIDFLAVDRIGQEKNCDEIAIPPGHLIHL